MLVVSAGVGIPIVLGLMAPTIPQPLWVIVFVSFFAATIGMFFVDRGRAQRAVYVAALALCWVLVVTTGGYGLLPILLVVIAAIGPEVVRLRSSMVIVALNTGVLAVAMTRGGADGTEIAIATAFYLLIQIASVLSVHTLQREKGLRRDLAEANVDLRAATVLLEESARSAERLRISRELHDLMGHQLTVLTLELEAARHREGEASHKHIENADAVARSLLSDVRSTVSELRSAPSSSLAEMLADVGRDVPGLDVAVAVDEDLAVDEEQKAVLVRTVQELVTNTIRHAEARELGVHVGREDRPAPEPARIVLSASDDGVGAVAVRAGNGLRGIEERFAQLGGAAQFSGGAAERSGGTERQPERDSRLEVVPGARPDSRPLGASRQPSRRPRATPRQGFRVRAWMPVR